jgi:hypothetical protein
MSRSEIALFLTFHPCFCYRRHANHFSKIFFTVGVNFVFMYASPILRSAST